MFPPNINPANSNGYKILTVAILVSVAKAPKSASPTRHADPIANPFPIAAVVFPAASSPSVFSLTYAPISAISAIPPALSLIGPYPSIAKLNGKFDNIPRAANEIP